jgi:biotin carboxylase
VGASKTYKIHNAAELEQFFAQKPAVDTMLEEFIHGTLFTFDGLADRDGNLVFYTSHQSSQGVMEIVNNDDVVYYYSLREIPADLEAAGRRVLKAFDVRERFFHFEFFRSASDNEIIALEVNMRPPGGMTTDMFNFANDIDIYQEWAQIVVNNRFTTQYSRKYHCCYISRKFNRSYAHSHEQVLGAFGEKVVHHDSISSVFRGALGDYGYLVRSPDLDEIYEIVNFIHQLA